MRYRLVENSEDICFVDEAEKCFQVWFAKYLCFIKIQKGNSSNRCKENQCGDERSGEANATGKCCRDEYCFVRCFEILDKKILKTDKIDQMLGCICLGWYRTSRTSGQLLPANEFDHVPGESLHDVVNLVPRNTMIPHIEKEKLRVNSHFRLCDGVGGLVSELYYVNRFLSKSLKASYLDGLEK